MRTKLNSEETSSNPTCRIWKTHQAKISFTCRGSLCRKIAYKYLYIRVFLRIRTCTQLTYLYATCTCFSSTNPSLVACISLVFFHPCVAW